MISLLDRFGVVSSSSKMRRLSGSSSSASSEDRAGSDRNGPFMSLCIYASLTRCINDCFND